MSVAEFGSYIYTLIYAVRPDRLGWFCENAIFAKNFERLQIFTRNSRIFASLSKTREIRKFSEIFVGRPPPSPPPLTVDRVVKRYKSPLKLFTFLPR